MFRTRILMMLGGCLLVASAALADDIGFVDCSNRSEATEVFGKPRKSNDIVATVPCGERFVIVTYGFIFSRIQTRAGQVGYVYSSLISVDRAAASLPTAPASATPSIQTASEKTKVPSAPKTVAPTKSSTPSAEQLQPPAQAQVAAAQPAAATPATGDALVAGTLPNSAPAQPQLPVPDSTSSGSAAAAPAASAPSIKPDADAKPAPDVKQLEAQAEAALAGSTPATISAPSQPAQPAAATVSDVMPKASEPAATTAVPAPAQPDAQPAAAPAQPEAAPVEPAPAPAPVRASERTTWEKPLPSARKTALFEFYGGYSYTRTAATSSLNANNMGGVVGSVGWNFKSWLQFVGDSSYTEVTGTGVKNILYGNHFGARYFYRNRNRWGLTPFVEGLVGGSRSDVSVSGAGGYTTSANCISYKAGGGLDFHPMRHIDVRVFDVDYYRTSFGGQQQNNYTASAGIVIHLFGGGEQ